MKRLPEAYMSGNLVAMIDVVFQLIIFFVCTVALQDQTLRMDLILAKAPHGPPVVVNPTAVTIDVKKDGQMVVANQVYSQQELSSIMHKVVGDSGPGVPVIIRGDLNSAHLSIRKAMNLCTEAGIKKIKIAAIKEKGG